MVQLVIRCQPRVPVSSDELEQWLEEQVHGLRIEAPRGTKVTVSWPAAERSAESEPAALVEGRATACPRTQAVGRLLDVLERERLHVGATGTWARG